MDSFVYLRFVLSLVLVLGLILAALWAVRRFGLPGVATMRPSSRRRLSLVEVMAVDSKRRLVLVRRDDREHLLLVGGGTDLVVERDIPQPRFEVPA
jgi:flagellar protein FliO/FliZ